MFARNGQLCCWSVVVSVVVSVVGLLSCLSRWLLAGYISSPACIVVLVIILFPSRSLVCMLALASALASVLLNVPSFLFVM